MSDDDNGRRESNPDVDSDDEPRDSMEDVLAEALAEEDDVDSSRPSMDDGLPSLDDVDIRDALRAAMAPPSEKVSITRGVQKKLREDPELKGRFFADGWSTSTAPKQTYLITSLVMLVVVIIVYALIRPYGM